MARLDRSTLDEIISILEPELRDEAARRAYFDLVFAGMPGRPDLDLSGASHQATMRMVMTLHQFGTIDSTTPALWALCEAIMPRIGADRQARLEALREAIFEGPEQQPSTAVVQPSEPPAREHVFVSYSHQDRAFVEQLTADLQATGINVWIDRSGLKPGTRNWENALRAAIRDAFALVLVASPLSRQSNFVQAELDIAAMYGLPLLPVWAVGDHWIESAPMSLSRTQYVDMRASSYATNLPSVIEQLKALGAPSDEVLTEDAPLPLHNPYKGLRAFEEADTEFFFGRETLVEELLPLLESQRFLTLIGGSGSGKSSVIMAGVLPHLRERERWRILPVIVPGVHPLETLALLFADAFNMAISDVRKDLDNSDGRGLHLLADRLARREQAEGLILYVDQFEEAFTLTTSEDERRQFIDLLVKAINEPRGTLTVIVTLRADFYDRPLNYPELGKLVDAHSKSILQMTVDDLRSAIEKPAAHVGLGFEDGLVGDLLFEVRDQAGALPLLQFTLDLLYRQCVERDGGRLLTRAAYRALGGVRGALAQHAEATYAALPSDEHRRMARALFLRLIEPGISEQDTTRRRAQRVNLILTDSAQTTILAETADAFTDARLLVTEGGEEPTIEVSHEALIREWERLRTWLAEGREDVRLQNAIAQDADDWRRKGERADDLYRGARRVDAQAWAKRNLPSADEQAFLDASAAEETRREAAAHTIARRVENFRRASILLAVFVLLALGATVIVSLSANSAVHESQQAGTNVAIASIDRAHADTFRQQVEYDATVFAVNQARAQVMLGRFGIVPGETETLAPEAIIARATLEADPTPYPVETQRVAGTDMVKVPPGCFLMGSVIDSAAPVHQVCFEALYWIDRMEVSRAQYNLCVAAGTCSETATNVYSSADDQPVNNVSWTQALAYCRWRGARLPTEPEWEYAARGPASLIYPWGDQFEPDFLVYIGNSQFRTAPVGSRPPESASWVGALDMSGSVWEWVSTAFASPDFSTIFAYPYDPADGREDLTNTNVSHVTRGGSFNDDQVNTRAAHRGWQLPGETSESYQLTGIRCAASGTEQPGAEG